MECSNPPSVINKMEKKFKLKNGVEVVFENEFFIYKFKNEKDVDLYLELNNDKEKK